MDCLVERIFAMELREARVACKAVALGLAAVHQELLFVIKTRAAINAQTILVLLHELLAFLPFLLEVHLTAIFTAVGVIVVIRRTGFLFFFVFFFFFCINSIVKPQCHSRLRRCRRSNHSRSFVLLVAKALLLIHSKKKYFNFIEVTHTHT